MQRERTALAWRRTSLSVLAVGAVLSRVCFVVPGRLFPVAAALALALAVLAVALGGARYRRSSSGQLRPPASGGTGTQTALVAGACALMALTVTLLAAHALATRDGAPSPERLLPTGAWSSALQVADDAAEGGGGGPREGGAQVHLVEPRVDVVTPAVAERRVAHPRPEVDQARLSAQ
jgi:uncharacterized membrane protein YidH (DUF202 family)